MKLYRYMSIVEFIKMSRGETIKPYVHAFSPETGSKGLCFLGEETLIKTEEDSAQFTPAECLRFLPDFVNSEVLVEFETTDAAEVQASWGQYANPFMDSFNNHIIVDEYCVQEYQKDTLIPKRYAFPGDQKDFRTNPRYINYEDGVINIMELLEKTRSDSFLRFSLLPQMEDGKGFWTEVEYAPPAIGKETTKENWRRKRLVYGDLITGEEQCSIDMVLDSFETWGEEDCKNATPLDRIAAFDYQNLLPLVRLVLNGECPPNWEAFVDQFRQCVDHGREDGGLYKHRIDENIELFFKYIALSTVYPQMGKHYRLHMTPRFGIEVLDCIRKDFDIDAINKESSEILDGFYGGERYTIEGKVKERIAQNSIGEIKIEKIDGEYSVLAQSSMYGIEDGKVQAIERGFGRYVARVNGGIAILNHNRQRVLALIEQTAGETEWLSLSEKFRRSVENEKRIKQVEKELAKDSYEK